ncbi:MAG: glycoside hydrolase family 16 protein, partial [Saprospiraceae bacterium]|nr:glycoside hydrolase family 16 protein [Saprospiraceae bacterium]
MRIQSLIIAMLAVSGSAAAQCPQLIWADEFDGTSLDIDNWNHQVGDGCDIGLCDWGNNELQYYKAENTEVGEGTLKIIAKRENVENKVYTSSRLNTKGHSEWTYGRFEARIKLPTGKGIWPAFWMLSSDEPYGSWPQSGEIDIMELIGSEPATAHGTLHFGALPPGNRSVSESYILNDGIFNDAFHTFAIEWEEKKISWYVDDYLYASKTNLSLGGSMWPFDHDFHILLNLAVGGNWPGFPDGSTQFPQTMEVDYVRVYDGFMPNISGDRSVENQAQGIRYELNSIAPGASIVWQVPDDAEIVEGQGTSSITVNFKDGSGDVLAIYTDDCRTDTLTVSVKISPAFESELSLENFDDPANIEFNFASGAFSDEVANPGASEINDSPLCGKYDRNVAETFDVLIYDVDILTDVAPYLTDDKRFFIDVYTDAPVGTTILMQLENDTRSQPQNFPSGRHSRFEARTSIQGAWERLHLTLLDQPDPNTPNTAIDQIVFLFASNTSSSNTFYFDNFDSYAPAKVVPTREQNSHR